MAVSDRFDVQALESFYDRVSSSDGIEISELQESLDHLFSLPRSSDDLKNYRLHRPPWKKLSDEIVQVSQYFKFREIMNGRVCFPLDNNPPDAICWDGCFVSPVGIEVTIAQGRERYALANELATKGMGRGYLGLQDGDTRENFETALSRGRVMYTSDEALSTVKEAIMVCLNKKSRPEHRGLTLLVQAHLSALPAERWRAIEDDLKICAAQSPFDEVWVIGDGDQRLSGFQIK